jgi:4-hydroxybenzoate polyprenyltransferase
MAAVLAFGRLVRLSHTIFGLPFALASTALAHAWATSHGLPGLTAGRLALIVVAFTGARAAAMGFNRIVDRRFDAANPRTADRELPTGAISLRAAWALTIASATAFLAAAWALGPLPLLLSPLCLAIVLGYSLFKRFSWSSHLVLGAALSLAPGGAWIAVTGSFAGWPTPTQLMLAVATWVAGFDVLYGLADIGFDRAHGLHSIPARFGIRGALAISAALHLFTTVLLVALHWYAGLGALHGIGVGLIAVILCVEHAILRPNDLSRLGKAFFDLNGWVSLAYLAFTLSDLFLYPRV